MNPTPKNVLKSKTFWLNLISLAAVCYPPASAWVAANPVAAAGALAAANTLVRFATNGRVYLFSSPDTGNNESPESGCSDGTGIGGRFPAWVAAAGLAGAGWVLAPPACTPGAGTAPQAVPIPTIPIHATYHKGGTTVSYDTAGGLTVDQDSGK